MPICVTCEAREPGASTFRALKIAACRLVAEAQSGRFVLRTLNTQLSRRLRPLAAMLLARAY